MKTARSKPALCWTLALLVLCVTISGCSSLDRALYRTQVETRPAEILATNTVTITNVVVVPEVVATNQATGQVEVVEPVRTNVVLTPRVEYVYAPPVTVTNLVPRPAVEAGLKAVEGAPFPMAGLAGILLGWAYSAYAAVRNKKTAVAVIQGIEAGRRILQETPEGQVLDKKIKDALIEHQETAGVLHQVTQLVTSYTGNTVK
jgi:hypothetical protein